MPKVGIVWTTVKAALPFSTTPLWTLRGSLAGPRGMWLRRRFNRSKFEQVLTDLVEATQEDICELVPLVKTTKCYADDDAKLVLSVRDRQIMSALTEAFKQIQGKVCVGKAPPGYLERELAELLEAFLAS